MKKYQFKVGDIVQYIAKHYSLTNHTGIVKKITPVDIGVSWDDWNLGHNLNGRIIGTSGWYVFPSQIELYCKKQRDQALKKGYGI